MALIGNQNISFGLSFEERKTDKEGRREEEEEEEEEEKEKKKKSSKKIKGMELCIDLYGI